MQNILASEIRASIESKIFKSRFYFHFYSSSLLSFILPCFLVPFGWAFSRLHFSWKCFWESFSNLRIWCKERKVGSGTRFSWRFSGQHCIFFFSLFLGPPRLNMVQFERSLPSAQGKWASFPWPSKPMTSQAVQGPWIHTGSYLQFWGEWVNALLFLVTQLDTWPIKRGG